MHRTTPASPDLLGPPLSTSPARPRIWALALAAIVASAACGQSVDGGTALAPLTIKGTAPDVLVPGSRLFIEGSGFVVPEAASLLVIVRGTIGPDVVEFAAAPTRIDDGLLALPISGDVAQALIRDDGRFEGRVTVLRTTVADGTEESAERAVSFGVARQLVPSITAVDKTSLYPMDDLVFSGAGFLFEDEGLSLIEFRGVMNSDNPLRSTFIDGLQVPAIIPELDRGKLNMVLTPDILGVLPGRFEGEVRVVNAFAAGGTETSTPFPVRFELNAPRIDTVSPQIASRGAWIRLTGQGFIPPDGLLQAAMVLQLEGRFVTPAGEVEEYFGARALTLVPDTFGGNTAMSIVLRAEAGPDGELTGLGVRLGRFSGTVTPLVLLGPDRARGVPFPFGLEIKRQKQIFHLRALPGFDDALTEFGLLVEKDAIKARILEVLRRDYSGISIDFTWETPREYAEYGIVEIAGRDPNGSGLFGLDNTDGKDVGNVRFDDIIGGFNADTQQNGYSAYGGVFPGEFMNLSTRSGTNPMASPRFDDIFEPVAPALGGKPALPNEIDAGTERGYAVADAVLVFANLTGSTISHEIGHTLGLAAYDGQFHNPGDNPGWLMDSGSFRPFEERAEIDGQGPSFFGPPSRAYLESILPLD